MTVASKRTADWSDKVERSKIGFNPSKTENSIGQRSYAGEKSRKIMKHSKVLEERQNTAIDEKQKLLKNIESQEALEILPLKYHSN